MVKIPKKELRCPECGSTNFYEDKSRREMICKTCGFVISAKKQKAFKISD